MEAMFARYFDGDLDDREVQAFLDAVEADPKLERELRAYEQVLALGKELPSPALPAAFTERVMADLPAGARAKRARMWQPPLLLRWAPVAAAALLLAYAGGWLSGRDRLEEQGTAGGGRGATTSLVPASVSQKPASTGLHYVRLVYVPSDPRVEHVTVAGSFNNWQPSSTPMQRQDGVWSTIIVLSPGSYEYMFVEDGERWVTDPLALETRDDGFGNVNSILDVES